MKPDNSNRISFGLFADAHYAPGKIYLGRYCPESVKKLAEAVRVFNKRKVDFMVNLGDIIDKVDDKRKERENLIQINKVIKVFRGDCHFVLGNHDITVFDRKELLNNSCSFCEEPYYSFDKGMNHFIILDGNYDINGRGYEEEEFDWKNTYINNRQIDWLIKDLKISKDKRVIIFTHQNIDYKSNTENRMYSHSLNNADRIRQIFGSYANIKAVIQGHYHRGSFKTLNNINYLTLKAMCEGQGLENNAFAVATIDENNIYVEGFGRQKSCVFSI